jgi:RNA polymerase primary sigma factor
VSEAASSAGSDVRAVTDSLVAQADSSGHLTSADVARVLAAAEVTPAQGRKILKALAQAGVTVVVDGSAGTAKRRRATPTRPAAAGKAASSTRPAVTRSTPAATQPSPATVTEPVPATSAGADQADADPAAAEQTSPEPAKKAPAKRAKKAPAKKPAAKAAKPAADRADETAAADEAGPVATDEPAAPAKKTAAKKTAKKTAAKKTGRGKKDGDGEQSEDFDWDDEDSEALRQARKDAELTTSADSVRAYLKQIGRVPLLNAEQEVDLAKRIEAGLYAAELLRQKEESGEEVTIELRREL